MAELAKIAAIVRPLSGQRRKRALGSREWLVRGWGRDVAIGRKGGRRGRMRRRLGARSATHSPL